MRAFLFFKVGRGHMRIRTAVAAFAELCLTTRLCDLIVDLTFKIGAKIGPLLTFGQTLPTFFLNIKKNFLAISKFYFKGPLSIKPILTVFRREFRPLHKNILEIKIITTI
jgi:hypothetical protein